MKTHILGITEIRIPKGWGWDNWFAICELWLFF